MDLLSKLRAVADTWVVAHQRTDPSTSLKTLGVRAVANAKLFDRSQMTVAIYERVALWLGDPVNWPAALVPNDAAETLGDLGVTVPAEQRLVYPVAA